MRRLSVDLTNTSVIHLRSETMQRSAIRRQRQNTRIKIHSDGVNDGLGLTTLQLVKWHAIRASPDSNFTSIVGHRCEPKAVAREFDAANGVVVGVDHCEALRRDGVVEEDVAAELLVRQTLRDGEEAAAPQHAREGTEAVVVGARPLRAQLRQRLQRVDHEEVRDLGEDHREDLSVHAEIQDAVLHPHLGRNLLRVGRDEPQDSLGGDGDDGALGVCGDAIDLGVGADGVAGEVEAARDDGGVDGRRRRRLLLLLFGAGIFVGGVFGRFDGRVGKRGDGVGVIVGGIDSEATDGEEGFAEGVS